MTIPQIVTPKRSPLGCPQRHHKAHKENSGGGMFPFQTSWYKREKNLGHPQTFTLLLLWTLAHKHFDARYAIFDQFLGTTWNTMAVGNNKVGKKNVQYFFLNFKFEMNTRQSSDGFWGFGWTVLQRKFWAKKKSRPFLNDRKTKVFFENFLMPPEQTLF